MPSLLLLFCFLVASSSLEVPIFDGPSFESTARTFVEFSSPVTLPLGWVKEQTPVDPFTPITLTWALKQRNLDVLDEFFWDVSNPRSHMYGKHLSLHEIADFIAPEKAEIDLIMEWIQSFSPISMRLTLSRDFIHSEFPVVTAERILGVKFSYFSHPESGLKFLRSLEPYTLPVELAKKIDFVGGVHRLPTPRPMVMEPNPSNEAVTPITIRSRYNVTDVGSATDNTMATSQFLLQWYSPSDLSQFFATYDLPDYQVAEVIGENRPEKPGVEASLDIQYLMGVGQNITTSFYFTGGFDNVGQEPFLEWIVALNDDPDTPLVNSVSYGDYENSISSDYLDRCNIEFQKFGTSGHSLLFASGDFGVGCEDGPKQSPIWPTSSPYVTSVGGTQMISGQEVGVTFSGGGFSNYFAMPSYQKDAVSKFLSSSQDLPDSSYYNASGRAYPDISAFATNYQVVVAGKTKNVGGTSASTPTVSGIISLLNDLRLSQGLSSLGFLNQAIYQVFSTTPEAYFDITAGSNPYQTCPGFTATAGWDPITGVGSPDYSILKQLVA